MNLLKIRLSLSTIFFLFPFAILHSDNTPKEDITDYYIRIAEVKKLSEERYWSLLLHYQKSIVGNSISEIDGLDFFLSPKGNQNPKEELEATIRGLFRVPTEEELQEITLHPICKYPERFRWLNTHLNFDKSLLPKIPCTRFNNWIQTLNPNSIQLIFASFYLNNPASLFGHNLLKIGSGNPNRSPILDYAVNFAANYSTEDNPLTYTIRGLFGGYPGSFSIFPYYFKINEYNDIESRDLWEYELNFDEAASKRIVSHIWELGSTYFDYYFLDENCSYHLLSLLEIGNEKLHLRDRFRLYTIPADTVKVILETEGLIRKKKYRPSLVSKLYHKIRILKEREKNIFYDLISEKIELQAVKDSLSEERFAYFLDAILEAKRYQKTFRKQKQNDEETYTNFLLERSKLKYPPILDFESPPPSPESGHGSGRIKINRGGSTLGGFTDISVRAAYHDFMNYDAGFIPFSTIEYASIQLRQYDLKKNPTIEESSLIKIISLAPVNQIHSPFSFYIDIGSDSSMIQRKESLKSKIFLVPFITDTDAFLLLDWIYREAKDKKETPYRISNFNVDLTFGYSISDQNRANSVHWILSLQAGAKARGNSYYREGLLIAPQVAFFSGISYERWKLGISAQYYGFSVYGYKDDYKISPIISWSVSQNWEVRLEGKIQKNYEEYQMSAAVFF